MPAGPRLKRSGLPPTVQLRTAAIRVRGRCESRDLKYLKSLPPTKPARPHDQGSGCPERPRCQHAALLRIDQVRWAARLAATGMSGCEPSRVRAVDVAAGVRVGVVGGFTGRSQAIRGDGRNDKMARHIAQLAETPADRPDVAGSSPAEATGRRPSRARAAFQAVPASVRHAGLCASGADPLVSMPA